MSYKINIVCAKEISDSYDISLSDALLLMILENMNEKTDVVKNEISFMNRSVCSSIDVLRCILEE